MFIEIPSAKEPDDLSSAALDDSPLGSEIGDDQGREVVTNDLRGISCSKHGPDVLVGAVVAVKGQLVRVDEFATCSKGIVAERRAIRAVGVLDVAEHRRHSHGLTFSTDVVRSSASICGHSFRNGRCLCRHSRLLRLWHRRERLATERDEGAIGSGAPKHKRWLASLFRRRSLMRRCRSGLRWSRRPHSLRLAGDDRLAVGSLLR